MAATPANIAARVTGGIERNAAWLIGLAIAAFVVFRLILEAHYAMFDPDEALSLLVGRAIVHGGLPYVDAYSNRGPLLYLLLSLPLAIAGEYAYRAIHVLGILWLVGGIAWMATAVRRRLGEDAAVYAAWIVVLLATVVVGIEDCWALNSDAFMSVLAAGGYLVLLRSRTGSERAAGGAGSYAVAGVLLALAFLTKQNSAFVAVGPPLFILTADRERWPAKGLAFGAGYAAPVAVCLAIYAAAGELARFWYFFYQYNATYAAGLAVLDRLPEFARMLADFYGWLVPLFALGLLAVRRPIASASPAWLLAIWIGTASLAILASGRVWVNYLWLSHWPLAIVAGWSLSACLRRIAAAGGRRAARGWTAVALVAVVLVVFVARTAAVRSVWVFDRLAAVDASGDGLYVGGILQTQKMSREKLVAAIRKYAAPGEAIFVTGYAPEIYVLAGRPPASAHVMSMYLEGITPGLDRPPALAETMLPAWRAEMETARPKVIVNACALEYYCGETSPLWPEVVRFMDDLYTPTADYPEPAIYVRR